MQCAFHLIKVCLQLLWSDMSYMKFEGWCALVFLSLSCCVTSVWSVTSPAQIVCVLVQWSFCPQGLRRRKWEDSSGSFQQSSIRSSHRETGDHLHWRNWYNVPTSWFQVLIDMPLAIKFGCGRGYFSRLCYWNFLWPSRTWSLCKKA